MCLRVRVRSYLRERSIKQGMYFLRLSYTASEVQRWENIESNKNLQLQHTVETAYSIGTSLLVKISSLYYYFFYLTHYYKKSNQTKVSINETTFP